MSTPRYRRFLVDGRHLLYRTASVLGDLTANTGLEEVATGAVHGFMRVLLASWEEWADPDCWICVCWDGGYKHRRDLYPDYKKGRHEDITEERRALLDTLEAQQTIIQEVLVAAGWAQARAPDFEADDTMATLADLLGGRPGNTAIYTGDHDLHQCVTDTVHCVTPAPPSYAGGRQGERAWDIEAVTGKWTVGPLRVPEYKALAGDSSDNIPGTRGIGDVWAKKLLAAYPDLDSMVVAARKGPICGNPNITGKLLADEAGMRMSHTLATVVRDAPVSFWPRNQDRSELTRLFRKYRFIQLSSPRMFNQIIEMGRGKPS